MSWAKPKKFDTDQRQFTYAHARIMRECSATALGEEDRHEVNSVAYWE